MIRVAAQHPPSVLIRRAAAFGKRKFASFFARRRDAARPTFLPDPAPAPLSPYYRTPDSSVLGKRAEVLLGLSGQFLAHRFDLLGSGWTCLSGAIRCRGVEGYRYEDRDAPPERPINAANREESVRIRAMIDPGYAAIDWHLDFKSGYRWPKDTWYRDIPYGHLPGVDIKVPWELARMQHLPTLAFAHALARDGAGGFAPADRYAREFRNQVLDFIADNPPRYGVNWRCTMDVAIRIANWLAARDLFLSSGAVLDADFEAVFARSVLEHGRHIAANLEWDPKYRGNHYLADIVGLLYAAAYLPRSAETDGWLKQAVAELVAETERQFLADGGNFEGSTAYHRLSAEMVLHATGLVLALPDEKRTVPGLPTLPPSHFERLARAADFAAAVTKPSGRMAQIGDNDSGRFLKLAPTAVRRTVAEAKALYANLDGYDEIPDDADYWDDDHLHSGPLLAAFAGLLEKGTPEDRIDDFEIETSILGALGRAPALPVTGALAETDPAPVPVPPEGFVLLDAEIRVPGGRLLDGLKARAFPDFGLYVWRSERLFLTVRCGPLGQNGRGGHCHNDQLAVELAVDGEDWIAETGTYLYTPVPERRNAYRSVHAHFAPRLGEGQEPGRLDLGPFWLGDEAKARCAAFGTKGFLGSHRGFGPEVFRRVELSDTGIRITDVVKGRAKKTADRAADRIVLGGRDAVRAAFQPPLAVSPGYGLVFRERAAG